MPRRDRVIGPEPLRVEDIDALNLLFSDAFTDRYHRDGMAGVRVPPLNPAIWRYALAVAGEGAMQWRDQAGELAAFNLAHASGSEGWMGPLAVRSDLQRGGVGRRIVQAGVEYLRRCGCRVIGLETMPRTVDNIGFYSGLGFRPGHLTISMQLAIPRGAGTPVSTSSDLGARETWWPEGRRLLDRLMPGLDFSREVDTTLAQGLGDLSVVADRGEWSAFALWHHVPLAQSRPAEEIRILKLVAADQAALRKVVDGIIAAATVRGVHRIAIRCQTAQVGAYETLLDLGFRAHWTDLRMALSERPEQAPLSGIVLSNWEI
ncbi:MAG: GNAT family N-acetyltransferase [Gemmatimonadales bacterium]